MTSNQIKVYHGDTMPDMPEKGGLLNRFLRLLKGGEGIKPPGVLVDEAKKLKKAVKQKEPVASSDLPKQVVDKLKKITSSHKANEILEGAEFDEDSIKHSEELGRLLIDVISQVDSSVYHNGKWLEDTLKRIVGIESNSPLSPKDLQNLKQVKANIETLFDQAQSSDKRLIVKNQQMDLAVHGQPVSSEQTFEETLDEVANDGTEEGQNILLAVKSLQNGPQKDEDFHNIAEVFETEMSSMAKKVNQTNKAEMDKFAKNYDHARRAFEKLGRLYIEKHPQEGRFSQAMGERSGRRNIEMEKAIHENSDLMDYWFYKILEPVLYNEHLEQHRELYNLYTAGDMESFLEVVGKKRDAAGRNVGKELVGYYTTLKNCILQSHDMDYFAAHPMQDMREFMSSTAQFNNDYIDFAHQDPLVALSKRAYEVALLQIREDHNGYIPREYLKWDRGRLVSKLEERVEKIVKDAIRNGQLYHIKEDPVTGKPDLQRWGRVQIDPERTYTLDELYGGQPAQSDDWKRQLGDFKISAALKQAKGLALVDMRLLEIIAKSKGTGSDAESVEEGNYTFDAEGRFNSIPYEGITRHIEPIIHHFSRWRIAKENYLPFFSMMISDKPGWSTDKIKRLINLHLEGDHETMKEEFGEEINTRLLAMDNPFSFSGMWGTMTGWRIADSSVDWDDWEKEKYSTANKLMTTGDRFIRAGGHGHGGGHHEPAYNSGRSEKKVSEHFLYSDNHLRGEDGKTAKQLHDELKNEYRRKLRDSGDWDLIRIAGSDNEFEVKWNTVGIKQTHSNGKKYEAILKEHFKWIKKHDPHIEHEMEQLEMKLGRAYRARTWIQAAMRSPLIVARECKAEYNIAGYRRKGPLRKKIIYDLLGIDIDDFSRTGTPTKEEMNILGTVTDIESAVFSAQQIALRENRDLGPEDFDILTQKSTTPQEIQVAAYAKLYWEQVTQAMLGDFKAKEWYRKIGIEDADKNVPVGLRFHKINWHQIEGISLENKGHYGASIFTNDQGFRSHKDQLLDAGLIDRDWRYLFSTEDMGWEYLNMGALGSRNPMRRAGDLGSHVAFNQGLEKILVEMLGPHLPREDFIKQLKEMWLAMAGDSGEPANDSCARVLYTTLQLYRKEDWAKIPLFGPLVDLWKPSSVMQEIFNKTHGQSMGANERLQYIHDAVAAGIIPERAKSRLTGKRVYMWGDWDAHIMEQRLGATTNDVVYEILAMGIMIAFAVMIYNALKTGMSDDEEGGGGHGGGHGH